MLTNGDEGSAASAIDCELAILGRLMSAAATENRIVAQQIFLSPGIVINRRLCLPGRSMRLARQGIEFPACMDVIKDSPLNGASFRSTLMCQLRNSALGCILDDIVRDGVPKAGQTSSPEQGLCSARLLGSFVASEQNRSDICPRQSAIMASA